MWDTGAKLAERQYYAGWEEIQRRLSPDSQYMAGMYAQRIGNDPQSMGRAFTLLSMARQPEEKQRLARFVSYCNIRRFLGQDDACTRETVRSAVEPRSETAGPNFWTTGWPVTGRLASQVNGALSFSLVGERLAHQATRTFIEFWKNNSYAEPGLLIHHQGGADAFAFLLVAAHNQSPWTIKAPHAILEIPASAGAPLQFHCGDSNLRVGLLGWDEMAPGDQIVEACTERSGAKLDDLLRAVREAQHHGSISVRVQSLFLQDPYVMVTADDDGPAGLFKVSPAEFTIVDFPGSAAARAEAEVNAVSCYDTGICRSRYQAASLAIYNFSRQRAALVAVIIGLLLGGSFGALSQRSLLFGSTLVAVPLAAAAAFIGYLIYSLATGPGGGFGGLAIIGLIGLYATLLVPFAGGFFVGMALIRLLQGLPEPSP